MTNPVLQKARNEKRLAFLPIFYNAYKNYLEESGLSENSKKQYLTYARMYQTTPLTQQEINHRARQKLLSPPYKAFLKHTRRLFRIKYSIPKRTGMKGTKPLHWYTKAEINKVIRATYLNRSLHKIHFIITLCYENGLRISEALNVKPENIDTVNQRIRGVGKGNKAFDMALRPKTFKRLAKFMSAHPKGSKPLSYPKLKEPRIRAWREIKKVVCDILPHREPNEIHPHAFRHSIAMHMKQDGFDLLDIQMWLRHERLETIQHYAQADKAKVERRLLQPYESRRNNTES